METVVLKNNNDLESKLEKINELVQSGYVKILINKSVYMEVFDFFIKHKEVSRLKEANDFIFFYKDLKISLKSINHYV